MCGHSLHLFVFLGLISYDVLRNEEKYFTLKAPLKLRGLVLNVVFFSWNNHNTVVDSEFPCSLQELYLCVNMNLKKNHVAIYIYYISLFPIICNRKLAKRLKVQFSP